MLWTLGGTTTFVFSTGDGAKRYSVDGPGVLPRVPDLRYLHYLPWTLETCAKYMYTHPPPSRPAIATHPRAMLLYMTSCQCHWYGGTCAIGDRTPCLFSRPADDSATPLAGWTSGMR